MTYRQLLLTTGGGVLSPNQMDEQSNNVTIAIGIGGTGVTCLRSLKQQVYTRLQPDVLGAVVPSYSHIRFLAVDTDKNSLSVENSIYAIDPYTEFFDISSNNIRGKLAQTRQLAEQPELAWLRDDLDILSADAGAGGVRQIGRMLICEKSAAFLQRVSSMVLDAKRGLENVGVKAPDVNIHIFAGLGGGTGSGTFLDICYLVQEALKLQHEFGHAKVCGYFFLPDVNLAKPEIQQNAVISGYIMSNGFAALKELDHCMNFRTNGDSWRQVYRGSSGSQLMLDTKEKPVDICHMVSSVTASNKVPVKGFDYAINVVCDFVMQFAVKNDITMESHIANYARAVGGIRKEHGGNYQYCILGASNAVVPMREITTYLASRLFERFASVGEQLPSDEEIAKFAETCGLTPSRLRSQLLKGSNTAMPSLSDDLQDDWKSYLGMGEQDRSMEGELVLPEMVLDPCRRKLASLENTMMKNAEAMTADWSPNVVETEDTDSLVCRVYNALKDVVLNPKQGAYCAAEILDGPNRKNLVTLLAGAQAEARKKLEQRMGDQSLRIKEVKDARHEFLTHRISRKKNFVAFLEAVENCEQNDAEIAVLKHSIHVISELIQAFSDLYGKHFSVYEQTVRNLTETFHENYDVLCKLSDVIEDPFIMPLMRISDMKPTLDKTVEDMNLDHELREFNLRFFCDSECWLRGEENKICSAVSSFFVEQFSQYTNKTITDYLQIRFNSNDPEVLTGRVHDEIMINLNNRADPMFWMSNVFQLTDASPVGYCCVPDSASSISLATDRLLMEKPGLQKVNSKLADRIFFLNCVCGVPLFAYNCIPTYCETYHADRSAGKHLYEHSARDERNWENLFDLQPYSLMNKPTQAVTALAEIYDRAVACGVIEQTPGMRDDYSIRITPDAGDVLAQAKAAQNMAELREALERINRFVETRYENVSRVGIANDGAQGHEEKVRRDHAVASEYLMGLIRSELEKTEALEKVKEELEERLKKIVLAFDDRDTFFRGLMTGVLNFEPTRIAYTRNEYGMTTENVLSDPTMEPYGKLVPLYQAYITYTSLDGELKKAVADESDDRLIALSPEMKTVCEQLAATFTDPYMGLMQRQAMKTDRAEEIKSFFIRFRRDLDDFRQMYCGL